MALGKTYKLSLLHFLFLVPPLWCRCIKWRARLPSQAKTNTKQFKTYVYLLQVVNHVLNMWYIYILCLGDTLAWRLINYDLLMAMPICHPSLICLPQSQLYINISRCSKICILVLKLRVRMKLCNILVTNISGFHLFRLKKSVFSKNLFHIYNLLNGWEWKWGC